MSERDKDWNTLGGIINSNSVDEVNEAYTVWAPAYDEAVKNVWYVGNDSTAKGSIEFIPNETSTMMLDVAAGTGLTAQSFRDAGFKGVIDAIDINAAMLELAAKKGLYRKTICQKVTTDEPLNVENGIYDVVIIGGSMHDNHVPYDCIMNVMDALKLGGFFIFNSRITAKTEGYRKNLKHHIQQLVNAGKIDVVKEDVIPYHDLDKPDASKPMTALLFVLKKR